MPQMSFPGVHVAGFLSVGPARAAWPRAWQLSTGPRSVPAFPAWRGSTAPLRRRLGGTRHARQRSAIPGAACKGRHHRGLATWGITPLQALDGTLLSVVSVPTCLLCVIVHVRTSTPAHGPQRVQTRARGPWTDDGREPATLSHARAAIEAHRLTQHRHAGEHFSCSDQICQAWEHAPTPAGTRKPARPHPDIPRPQAFSDGPRRHGPSGRGQLAQAHAHGLARVCTP